MIGVQVEACAPFRRIDARREPRLRFSRCGRSPTASPSNGQASSRSPLIQTWVDEIVVVGEDEVAEAMVFLLERTKLVVEGAGAVGVAALLGRQARRPGRRRHRAGPVRRQRRCRPAGRGGASPRDAAAQTAGAAGADPGSAGSAGDAARAGRAQPAPTWWTSSTSARAWTCTSRRRPCSWCWRRAGRSMPPPCGRRSRPAAIRRRRRFSDAPRSTSAPMIWLAASASGCH